MGYTKRKIRWINFSFLIVGFVFSCSALYCAWYGWPHGVHAGGAAGFTLFMLAAFLFIAFPAAWMVYPEKHPVRRELSRYGDFAQISERLDIEMTGSVYHHGPYSFTATMLVYGSGHEFQMVPYDQIASVEIERTTSDDPPAIVIHTHDGRSYQWYRTWMQGLFEPERTLARIRAAAHLEAPQADQKEPQIENQ